MRLGVSQGSAEICSGTFLSVTWPGRRQLLSPCFGLHLPAVRVRAGAMTGLRAHTDAHLHAPGSGLQ